MSPGSNTTVATAMKRALRRFARTVSVVASVEDGRRHAMAATAVSEVSLDPPTMLVCVNRSSSLFPVLDRGAPFSIGMLGDAQVEVSTACGGGAQGEERFATGGWDLGALGLPYLRDAQCTLFCRSAGRLRVGTHELFLGAVVDVHEGEAAAPLLYCNGRYRSVA